MSDFRPLPGPLNAAFVLMLSCLIALTHAGCAGRVRSEPTVVGAEGSAQGQWRGKALVRNKVTGQSATLSVDVLAQEPSRLRMELMGSFGVHVASIAMRGRQVSYSLTQQKRFIVASADESSVSQVVPVKISPKVLLSVLFERELPKPDWKCEIDPSSGLRKSCVHEGEKIFIQWVGREGRSRKLNIDAADARIDLVLEEARSKVEASDGAFVLAPPEGYRVERHANR
jgi:hypothetical protein